MELEKLKKEVDLLDYIVSTGGQVKRVGADTYRLDPCPVCGRKGHFTINTAGNYYKSFSECCKGGSIIDYMIEVEGMTMKGATERLEGMTGDNPGQTARELKEGNTERLEGIDKKEAVHLIETAGKNPCQYYITRGLTEDIIRQYKLGYLPDGFNEPGYGPEFEYVLPVTDSLVILHSDNGQVKYKNYGKADILNKEYLQDRDTREIYITEGMFDALSLETIGKPAIALNGVNMANWLCSLIEGNKDNLKDKRLVLALDNDGPGRETANKIKEAARRLGLHCQQLQLDGHHDVNDYLRADREGLLHTIERIQYQETVYEYLLDDFELDQKKRMEEKDICTGLNELDNALGGGLYPGLYTIGSVPSLGKTAFILQVADYIAAQGQGILFFSLEMSKYELVCRSLSRILHEKGSDISTGHVLNSQYQGADIYPREDYQRALQELRDGPGRCMTIKEGGFTVTIHSIREMVDAYIQRTGARPVVVVDYLQVIQPADIKMTEKQHVDMTVVELKRISRDLDLPLIVVSSFNRASYNIAADFTAFKESGSVEYTADVVMAMQLRDVKGDDNIDELKNREPRELSLVMLKNRRGRAYERIDLDYWPKFNFFKVSPDSKTIKKPY